MDFSTYQSELDKVFHREGDVYPRNSAEYAEGVQFVEKLAKLRASKQSNTAVEEGQPNEAAQALGLPSTYDPRFRVNVAVVAGKGRAKAAAKAVQRIIDRTHTLPTPVPTGEEVVSQYTSMLPFFEDFLQRRQLTRLRKLLADRATLPIAPFEQQIVEAVRASPVVVVAGDTGCGKSTQLPQFLLRAGFRRVVCTQPRRISAISLCRRVAFETLNVYGSDVAYKIRFNSTMTGGSRIVFCTEGILLRMLAGDPQLGSVDIVIVDEVHERHLTTDLLLALLRALVLQKPAMRVLLMSATINVQAYSDYFGAAPIIQVPGRLYPITVEYVPPRKTEQDRGTHGSSSNRPQRDQPRGSRGGEQDRIDPAPYLRLLQRLDSEVPSSQRGDLLVFVAGMADILALTEVLRPYAQETRRWVVLPLHSALSVEEQDRVFDAAPDGVRKCILSTNIAETSVTIDGVRFVADSGRAKELLHDLASGGGSLQEGWISRASAEQRKGRAGRTGPGRCFRMYSKEQFEALRPFALPEVQRVRLESVVLQIKAMAGSSMNPRRFGFIDPPPEDALEAAMINLKQAGALSAREDLTALGAVLSLLPVDVHIGKLLVLGALLRLPDPALTIAAALSVQSPFVRLAAEGEDDGVRGRRAELLSPHGDALTLLAVFETWLQEKASGRGGGRRWCRRHGLEEHRLHEMAKLKQQFQGLLRDVGLSGLGTELAHGGEEGGDGGEGGEEAAAPPRKRRRHTAARHDRERLLDMQRARERERGRRVLTLSGEESGSAGSGVEADERDKAGALAREWEAEGQELRDLELAVAVDLKSMAAAAGRQLSGSDVDLLKVILAAALYPRVALPDEHNAMRREQDARFHTASVGDAALHPASALAGSATAVGGQDLLLYCELLETHRRFLLGLTPARALPALLLTATSVDCDAEGRRLLVDGWLLMQVHNDDGSGAEALVRAALLRCALERLLARRLRQARLPAMAAVPGDAAGETPHAVVPIGPSQGTCMPALVQRIATEMAQEAARTTVDEEALAEGLAAAMQWPVAYSVEQLPVQRLMAQYEPVPEEPTATTSQSAARAKVGWKVAPWLTVASLKPFESSLMQHLLQPTMRRHWHCPGCSERMIATAQEVQAHINSCNAAQSLPADVLENAGYEQPQSGGEQSVRTLRDPEADNQPAAQLTTLEQAHQAVRWGRRVPVFNDSSSSKPRVAGQEQSAQAAMRSSEQDAGLLRRDFTCTVCGFQGAMTAVQILQHRRKCM